MFKKDNLKLFLAGGLANLALAPFYYVFVLLFSFPYLVKKLQAATSAKQAFWHGWWFGFGHFVFGLYWISNSLLVDLSFAWLIPFAISLIPAAAAIFIGLVAYTYKKTNSLILFAVAWVVAEILRTYIPFGGFPWNLIGYAVLFSDQFAQIAAIGGIYLCSFVIILLALTPLYYKNKLALTASIAMLIGGFAYGISVLKPTEYTNIKVALVQPAIPQQVKWADGALEDNFKLTGDLAWQAAEDTDLIVWPESAVPYHLNRDYDAGLEIAKVTPKFTVVGAGKSRGFADSEYESWNSLYLLDGLGKIHDTYDKVHLVPFGEYVPFRKYLPLDKITPGAIDFSRGKNFKTLEVMGQNFLPLICYEIIFPQYAAGNYDFIVNITNDGWFGNSTGPHQHLAAARLRAIEQGRPVLRAAYTGISAVIDANGKVTASLGYNKKGLVESYLPKKLVNTTIYNQYGNKIIALILAFFAIFAFMFRKKQI